MRHLWDSPTFAALVGIAGTIIGSLAAVVMRFNSKLNSLTNAMSSVAEDIREFKADRNIVRWSDIRNSKSLRK